MVRWTDQSGKEGYVMRSFWTGDGVVLGCARTYTLQCSVSWGM